MEFLKISEPNWTLSQNLMIKLSIMSNQCKKWYIYIIYIHEWYKESLIIVLSQNLTYFNFTIKKILNFLEE